MDRTRARGNVNQGFYSRSGTATFQAPPTFPEAKPLKPESHELLKARPDLADAHRQRKKRAVLAKRDYTNARKIFKPAPLESGSLRNFPVELRRAGSAASKTKSTSVAYAKPVDHVLDKLSRRERGPDANKDDDKDDDKEKAVEEEEDEDQGEQGEEDVDDYGKTYEAVEDGADDEDDDDDNEGAF